MDIRGGDKVRLKDGTIIKVNDMNDRYIFTTDGYIYLKEDVVEIIERIVLWVLKSSKGGTESSQIR